jgi:hypothetical protein
MCQICNVFRSHDSCGGVTFRHPVFENFWKVRQAVQERCVHTFIHLGCLQDVVARLLGYDNVAVGSSKRQGVDVVDIV